MLVSHEHKFIYIKSKKTASTSVQDYLEPYCENGIIYRRSPHAHMPARKVRKLVGEEIWNDYLKVTTIRNPWDKMVSLYYWSRAKTNRKWYIRLRLLYTWGSFKNPAEKYSFKDFIKVRDSKDMANVDKHILLVDGKMPDYFFVRFEHLNEDMENLCQKIGIPYNADELPKKKVGKKNIKTYKDHYDEETRDIIERAYEWETKVFGYEF